MFSMVKGCFRVGEVVEVGLEAGRFATGLIGIRGGGDIGGIPYGEQGMPAG